MKEIPQLPYRILGKSFIGDSLGIHWGFECAGACPHPPTVSNYTIVKASPVGHLPAQGIRGGKGPEGSGKGPEGSSRVR